MTPNKKSCPLQDSTVCITPHSTLLHPTLTHEHPFHPTPPPHTHTHPFTDPRAQVECAWAFVQRSSLIIAAITAGCWLRYVRLFRADESRGRATEEFRPLQLHLKWFGSNGVFILLDVYSRDRDSIPPRVSQLSLLIRAAIKEAGAVLIAVLYCLLAYESPTWLSFIYLLWAFVGLIGPSFVYHRHATAFFIIYTYSVSIARCVESSSYSAPSCHPAHQASLRCAALLLFFAVKPMGLHARVITAPHLPSARLIQHYVITVPSSGMPTRSGPQRYVTLLA